MAHGGHWTREQCLFLIIMKLATSLSWKEVAEIFRNQYGTDTTHKDCESKFNKDLKTTADKEFFVRYMETAETMSEDEDYIVALAIMLLGAVPQERRHM